MPVNDHGALRAPLADMASLACALIAARGPRLSALAMRRRTAVLAEPAPTLVSADEARKASPAVIPREDSGLVTATSAVNGTSSHSAVISTPATGLSG